MSVIIHNVTKEHKPFGMNQYELKINSKLICKFEHDRTPNGLVQCLRDAADALEVLQIENAEIHEDRIHEMLIKMANDKGAEKFLAAASKSRLVKHD